MKRKIRDLSNHPKRIMLLLVLFIACAETALMVMLYWTKWLGLVTSTMEIYIDVFLLVCIICPVIYWLVVYPLQEQVKELHITQNDLESSEENYRRMIDSIDGIVWEADYHTFAFTFVSQRAEKMLGYPVREWLDDPEFWASHIHPDDREWAVDFCVSSSREQRDHVFEYRMIAASGEDVWLRDMVNVVMENGVPTGLRGLMVDVSDRKQAELALAASDKRYQFLVNNLRDVIWEVDEAFCLTYISPSLPEMFGYMVEELLGTHIGDLLTPPSRQNMEELVRTLTVENLATGSVQDSIVAEFETLKKDGTLFWVEVNATVVFTANGRLQSIVGCSRDISDRKEAERTLRTSNDMLEKTINSLNEAVVIVDSDTREIRDVNLTAESMFGYTRDELIGANTSIFHVSEDMYRQFGKAMRESFKNKGFFETGFRMKRKSGWIFPAEVSLSPVYDECGMYNLHVSIIRDVSEKIRHEEELARAYSMVTERNAFVESVISTIQSGIIVLDIDLRISMINTYAAGICGKEADDLLGMPLLHISPELCEQVVERGDPDEVIVTFFDNRVVIGFTITDIRSTRGILTGTIICFKDLTEVIKIRNEMRQKQRLSAMGEVVARVAHEMRNPLFGMTAVGQILSMELTLDDSQQQLMDSFLKESKRLNTLVDELLDSTREIRLVKRDLNLISVLNDSLRMLNSIASEKGVTIITSRLPDEIQLHADPDKLEQVVLNLLKNATEACPQGGCVELVVDHDPEKVVIRVVDNGSGIPEESLENIFDVFYTTKKGGTGMGLSISKNIVEAHGGTLQALNNPDGGATFYMSIPLTGGAA